MAKTNLNDFDKIIMLDFGSQYDQLITRRIRDFGIYSEPLPHDSNIEKIKKMAPKGIIFSGGPNSVYNKDVLKVDPEISKSGIPILGICYGMQLMSCDLDGNVRKADNSEYGRADIKVTDPNAVSSEGLSKEQHAQVSHRDLMTKAPGGFKITAKSKNCLISAAVNDGKKFYGIQFHMEVRSSEYGLDILKNSASNVCDAKTSRTMDGFINMQVDGIHGKIGDRKAILGLSGGVDSSVTVTLLRKVAGDQLTAIFVDRGMLRKDKGDQIIQALNKDPGISIIRVSTQKRFLGKLKGVIDSEQKRKIIGKEFTEVSNEEAKKFKDVDFLTQDTLYTDVIESGTNTAQTIKSHHNVGGPPEGMHFKPIEPLRKLSKDEVCELGEKLGISHDLVWRQPFPGPGLGICVFSEVTEDKLKVVCESDAILRDEIKKARSQEGIWQYFTVLPGIRSVDVVGDGRVYNYTIGIHAVTSIGGVTADSARIPWDVLSKISTRIVDECDHISRVVYDITSKPSSTIEWE